MAQRPESRRDLAPAAGLRAPARVRLNTRANDRRKEARP
jgi:hypothetical protein